MSISPVTKCAAPADMWRLETISFVYAAAIGYGFSLDAFDTLNPLSHMDWLHLSLFFLTYLLVGADYAFVREVYSRNSTYSTSEFVMDIFIVFCFSRMLYSSTQLYNQEGLPVDFRWWFWLALVFILYVVWDLIEAIRESPDWASMSLDTTMAILCLLYFYPAPPSYLDNPFKILWSGSIPVVMGLITVIAYAVCVYVWRWKLLAPNK